MRLLLPALNEERYLAVRPLSRGMQVHIGELIALASGHGATDCSAMFLVGVAAYCASAPAHRCLVGTPSAHAAACLLAVTENIGSPFGWTAGVHAPFASRHRR